MRDNWARYAKSGCLLLSRDASRLGCPYSLRMQIDTAVGQGFVERLWRVAPARLGAVGRAVQRCSLGAASVAVAGLAASRKAVTAAARKA